MNSKKQAHFDEEAYLSDTPQAKDASMISIVEAMDVLRLVQPQPNALVLAQYTPQAFVNAKLVLQSAERAGFSKTTLLSLLKHCKQIMAPDFQLLSELQLPLTGLDCTSSVSN